MSFCASDVYRALIQCDHVALEEILAKGFLLTDLNDPTQPLPVDLVLAHAENSLPMLNALLVTAVQQEVSLSSLAYDSVSSFHHHLINAITEANQEGLLEVSDQAASVICWSKLGIDLDAPSAHGASALAVLQAHATIRFCSSEARELVGMLLGGWMDHGLSAQSVLAAFGASQVYTELAQPLSRATAQEREGHLLETPTSAKGSRARPRA